MLPIQPIKKPLSLISLDPAIVPNAGKLGIFYLCTACGKNGFKHITRAARRNGIIPCTVECPDGNIRQTACKAWNTCSANGNTSGEQLGTASDQLPDSVTAHRNASAVNTGKINFSACEEAVEQFFCRRKTDGRLFGKIFARSRCPCVIERNPFVNGTARTLGRNDDRIVSFQNHIDKPMFFAKHTNLLFVVRSAFSVTVEEKEERIGLFVFRAVIGGEINAVWQIKRDVCFFVFIWGGIYRPVYFW